MSTYRSTLMIQTYITPKVIFVISNIAFYLFMEAKKSQLSLRAITKLEFHHQSTQEEILEFNTAVQIISRRTCMRHSVAWRRHQMETLSASLALCAGNSPVTSEYRSQRPVTRSCDVFFSSAPWVNNREAGDLRRHRPHYDVIVMDHIYVERSN